MITSEDYDDIMICTPVEVETEPEPEVETPITNKLASFRSFPKLTASKENCKSWGRKGSPPSVHKTIMFTREAPFIELLVKKFTIISNEFPGVGNYTQAQNIALCMAADLMLEELETRHNYYAKFERNEEIPDSWIDLFLTEQAIQAKLQQRKFEEDLNNLWLPEFKKLGHDKFIEKYGQHSNIAEIVDYCKKAAPLVTMVSQDEGNTLSAKIKSYLTEWAQSELLVRRADIITALVNEGIFPDPSDIDESKKAMGILKYVGNSLGLSSNDTTKRGIWDLSSLRGS